MLVKIKCLAATGAYERVINTRTLSFIDARSVLISPGNHVKLAPGEYDRIINLIETTPPGVRLV